VRWGRASAEGGAAHAVVGAPQPLIRRSLIGPSVILAGYDFSDASSHALVYAAGLAERTGARLVVVSAHQPTIAAVDYPPPALAGAEHVAVEVRELLGRTRDQCGVLVECGDPATVIQRTATAIHADVVVVGRPRHPWLHLLGSVPARLMRHATQPVLVVP
jgi:nucleotide-binding universal stress UspA family protein